MIPLPASVSVLLTSRLINYIEPGGYIQWDEHDHVSQRVVTADPVIDSRSVHAVLDFVRPLDDMIGPRSCVPSPSNITPIDAFI